MGPPHTKVRDDYPQGGMQSPGIRDTMESCSGDPSPPCTIEQGAEMTTLTQHDLDSAPARRISRKPATGRPVLFAVLLGLAALLLMWVLIAGPALPLPLLIIAAGTALGIVALSWTVAGPRL